MKRLVKAEIELTLNAPNSELAVDLENKETGELLFLDMEACESKNELRNISKENTIVSVKNDFGIPNEMFKGLSLLELYDVLYVLEVRCNEDDIEEIIEIGNDEKCNIKEAIECILPL
jgi:hypothetical protein